MVAASPLPAAPLPTSGPACRSVDVSATYDSGNGGGGHSYQTYAFRDVGSRPCILRGFPRVVATEPGKPPVSASEGGFFVGKEVPETMTPGGVTTQLNLETERDCEARDKNPNTWPTSIYHNVTVSIPGGGDVALHGTFDLECGLYVGQFGVPSPDPVYPTPPLAGATFELELPASVKAGGQLEYVVDIVNLTDAQMALDPCPSYLQGLGGAGKTPLRLNGDVVHGVRAGQAVRFSMQIPVTLPANGATATATPTGGWTPPTCNNWPGSAGGRGHTTADALQPR